jgi:pyrimidine operon attenuation protein / uracil phosphoribosyltransferase
MIEHKTTILEHDDILLKIERMAWQVLELNPTAEEIVLLGIEPKGIRIANLVSEVLVKICEVTVLQGSIEINKQDPNQGEIKLKGLQSLTNKNVILVDDVLNSGRTITYATIPILKQGPNSLHTLVLANRDHASFPVKANIVGVSLSTTLQEHITFAEVEDGRMTVYLT